MIIPILQKKEKKEKKPRQRKFMQSVQDQTACNGGARTLSQEV